MSPDVTRPRRWRMSGRTAYLVFLHVDLVVLTIQVVILARENNTLKNPTLRASLPELKIGDNFHFDTLLALNGGEAVDSSRDALVFIFTTTCPFCAQTLPYWRIAAELADVIDLQVVGISLDNTDMTMGYVKDSLVVYPVLLPASAQRFRAKNRIGPVPQTVLCDRYGTVKGVWRGAINETKLEEVVDAISSINNDHTKGRSQ